jgi:tRNA nucleotidyltransferase/poly(A) polymerase
MHLVLNLFEFWKAGLMDLAAGLIRTPLPPKETFLDDPLRVLRAIRFGRVCLFSVSS